MRFSVASCALLATLLLPVGARAAEACSCLGPDGTFGVSAPSDAVDPAGADVADGVDADGETLSRPLDEISSLAPAPPAPVENVLWCEGSDDPRCAPQQGQPDAPRVSVPGPALPRAEDAHRDTIDPALHRTPATGAGPSAGVYAEVDRPPRA